MGKNNATSIRIIFFVLLVLSIFIVGCTSNASNSLDGNKNNNGDNNKNNRNIETNIFKTVSTGSLDSGDASVDLTPRGMENEKFAVDFSINTHSVDLSQFDLMQITVLEYDGKAIKPISAPALTGHHNSGTLIFDTGKEIRNFRITIKGIPAVEERVFEWQ